MRNVSVALAIGFLLVACGGEENQPPKAPVTPPPPAAAPAPAVVEAPKEEPKPKESLMDLEKKALKAFADAQNARDAKKLGVLYTDSAVVKAAGAPDATGRDSIVAHYEKLFNAFGDYKAAANRVFVKDDVVVVDWAFTGTHTGDLWGIKGTEKKVGVQGVDVFWFTPEGLIKEQHIYYDGGAVLSQIGLSKTKARGIPTLAAGAPQVVNSTGAADEAKNIETTKAMHAAFDAKKEADWLATITDTTEWDDASSPTTSKGKTDAKRFFKEMTTAFPDNKTTVANSWGFGDTVVSEIAWAGTHKGSLFGIPATKKSVNVKGLEIAQYKDGKIVKGWTFANSADLMMQLGVLPAPGAKDAKVAAGDKKAADPKAAAPTEKAADKKAAPAPAAPAKK